MSWFFKLSPIQIKDFLETKIFYFFLGFFCIVFLLNSQFAKWTETELYPVHHSKYLFSAFSWEFLFSLKPLFYSLLKIFFLFSEWLSVQPMNLSRCFFALNGLALLGFVYLYLKKKTNRSNAVLAVLVLAGSYIFLNRGFRIRSDLLLSSLSFFILWMNLNWKNDKKQPVLLFLFCTLFFITPKALYWIFLNTLLLENRSRKALFKKPSLKLTVALICFLTGISFLFKDPFFIKSLSESGKFYLLSIKSFYTPIFEKDLIELLPHLSIINFIDKNDFFIFLTMLKVFSTGWQLMDSKKISRQIFYFLALLGITLLHPEPKLVFFSALSPFFIIAFFTDAVWLKLINKLYSEKFKAFLLGGFFLYTFSYIAYFSYNTFTKRNNLVQKKIVGKLNHFYKNTPAEWSILDPACLIYSRKTTCKYLLYQEGFDSAKYIKEKDFDIILSSQFLPLFHLLTENKSSLQYVSVKNHILYKAFIIKDYQNLKQEELGGFNKTGDGQAKINKRLIFLDGDKVFNTLAKTVGRKRLQGAYFYTYIDSLNRSLTEELSSKKPSLLPFKIYNEKEWRKSLIPVKDLRIAIFYLPFPLDLNEETSLRVLLKYDKQ